MDSKVIELFLALLPTAVVGAVAYYFFNSHIKNEDNRRKFLLHKEQQKQSLPLRLQAYERLALLLERIAPGSLLLRMAPTSDDKLDYESLLAQAIEQEFEHNITQQIYVTDECWNIIRTAKNTIIGLIRKTNQDPDIKTSYDLREHILKILVDKKSPSDSALDFLKNEITEIF